MSRGRWRLPGPSRTGGAVVQTNAFAEFFMDERSIGALESEIADRLPPGMRALRSDDDGRAAPAFDGDPAGACDECDDGARPGVASGIGRDGLHRAQKPPPPRPSMNQPVPSQETMDRSLIAAMSDGVALLSAEGRIELANPAATALFGAGDLAGRAWAALWGSEEGRQAATEAVATAAAGRTARFQACLEHAGQAATWWEVCLSPVPDSGSGGRVLAVARDVTEARSNEARQSLLMQELSHRIKNTLAMVQAVATQTLRNAVSIEAASDALGSRLIALAHAHDVLMQGAWSSADLHGLVQSAVALHGDGEPDRFRVCGPALTLGPRPGLTLALMLHELGTNAVKYGALSTSDGHVAVNWDVANVDGIDHLSFRWEEVDGPPVAPPTRVGFGSRMIERSLVHSFGGTVALTYPPTGAVLTLDAPLSAVVADTL